MRYLVIEKENSSPEVVIWTKSQYRIPYRKNTTRECSHRDYLSKNNISYEDAISIGCVYYDSATGQSEVQVLPWDSPKKHDDIPLIQREVVRFHKQNPELADEIKKDWQEFQIWKEKSMASLAWLNRD